jgi:hypothetical protein
MLVRPNPDLASLYTVSPKAPPLPPPWGFIVRVKNSQQLIDAVAAARPHTTILLEDGVYPLEKLTISTDHLTIRSAGGVRENVILDGEMRFSRILVLRGAKDFLIADVTVANSKQYGIVVLGDSDVQRMGVYNVKFHNIWVRGLKSTHSMRVDDGMVETSPEQAFRIRPGNGAVRYCLFVNDEVKPFTDDQYNGDYVSGIDMMWLRDWVFSDNIFVGIRGHNGIGRGAIFVWVNSDRVVAERNLIINCDRGICFGNPSGDPLHMSNGIVRNNFIVAGNRQGIELVRTVNVKVHNNTVVATNLDFPTVDFNECAQYSQFRNNIVHGRAEVRAETVSENNLVGQFPGWFANPDIGDLHLTAAAAGAVGKAKPLPDVMQDFDCRPRKATPDIGAHEFKP